MKCFYHDDMDGRAAAFAVLSAQYRATAEFIPMDYGKAFPHDTITWQEEVWIVDFSIEPVEMEKLLLQTSNVVWIDHHKTAIEKYQGFPRELRGLRQDGVAACVLAWQYCHGDDSRPLALKLVADRDVWTWELGAETANFHAGAAMEDTRPASPFWYQMVHDFKQLARVLAQGAIINAYKDQHYSEMIHAIGFVATIDGYRCLCLNAARCGSEAFGADALADFEIVAAFYWDGRKFTVSLYSKSVDVSELAKARGGGGHRGAAGFQCQELPFVVIDCAPE